MSESTSDVLSAIAASPDDGRSWQALAQWYSDDGHENEVLVVRVLWPTLRDNLACATLEATLAEMARKANLLAEVAREVERRARSTPTDDGFAGVIGEPWGKKS